MEKAYGILHLSRLSGMDAATLIHIQELMQKEAVPPNGIVITGVSDDFLKYSSCGCFVTDLLDGLNLKRNALILLPDAMDNLMMYGPEFHDRLMLEPFRKEQPQQITLPGLQIIGIMGDAAEAYDFERWQAALHYIKGSVRILVTTHPVSHWNPVPREGFNQWRIQGALIEVTTAPTQAPQPFMQQIATRPGVCQYLIFNAEEASIEVSFKVVFDERARTMNL